MRILDQNLIITLINELNAFYLFLLILLQILLDLALHLDHLAPDECSVDLALICDPELCGDIFADLED